MAIVAFDKRLGDLVDPDAQPERIATGYAFTEGPIWHHRNRALTFSDVRGEVMHRWTQASGAQVFRSPSAHGNGNTYDHAGCLITCESETRRVTRTNPDGTIEPVATHFEGKRFNSPNDVICAANGDIIFTDPPYGLRQRDGTYLPQEIPYSGVFRVSARDGAVSVVIDDFDRPNGLVLTDDQRRLYVDDTALAHVRVFDVDADWRLTNGRVFADIRHADTVGKPDGMKLDSLGNLYVTANTSEGLWVYTPQGDFLGFIGLPESPANLAWGGDDWRTLFVTATTSVYRLQMKVAGQPVMVP